MRKSSCSKTQEYPGKKPNIYPLKEISKKKIINKRNIPGFKKMPYITICILNSIKPKIPRNISKKSINN